MGNSDKAKNFHRNEAPPPGSSTKTPPGQSFTGRGRVDITIINNNVNNFINNVTNQYDNANKTPKSSFTNVPKTAPFPKKPSHPTPGTHQFQPRKPPNHQSHLKMVQSDLKSNPIYRNQR